MPGFAFPAVGPWDVGSPPSRPGARGSRPSVLWSAKTAHSPSRGRSVLPVLPRYLVALVFLCVPCSCKARLGGESRLPAPGVFSAPVGTPTPDVLQGNHWLSQVSRLPLWLHALVSDPGGVLNARRSASRTTAFQRVPAVGFCSLRTTTLHISGLNTEPAPLIRPASDSRYRVCPRTSLLACWLDFSQVGLEPCRPSPTG
jgi:hypothetical protein